jgi:uncharacterized membrane protein YqjE
MAAFWLRSLPRQAQGCVWRLRSALRSALLLETSHLQLHGVEFMLAPHPVGASWI